MRVAHKRPKLKILIIEPQLIIAADVCSQLIKLGYDVIGVHQNTDDAILAIEQNRPDLLLMNIGCRHNHNILDAERLDQIFDIPLILLSGDTSPHTFHRIRHLPVYAFIVKPFDSEGLTDGLAMASTRLLTKINFKSSDFS